ncbi:MAG: hypothetical protein QOG52_2936 [Frankiaceae bacterium]|nr:hypothetical protein [Frankiaceae bacterium]
MEDMRFWVLGPLRVTSTSGLVPVGGPRQRAVLALLLVNPTHGLSTTELVEGVWGEAPPRSAERTLHAYVARLRSVLEPDRGPDGELRLLLRTATGYRMRLTEDQLDSRVFERSVSVARRQLAAGDTDAGALALRAAVRRWQGPAFADLLDFPAVQAAAQRLEHLRADAVADGVEAEMSLGRHETLVPELQNLVTAHPFDERLWAALALAHYRCGLQADALGTIRNARQVLADELGIDPGRELRELQAAILAGDPRLDLPNRAGVSAPDHPGLEGRAAALAVLRRDWARVASGHGRTVIVTGPQGSGRSRFLQACAAEVRASGGQVVRLAMTDAAELPTPAALVQLVEAGDGASLVVVDDLDRGNRACWVAVGRFAEAAADLPVLLVVAVREDLLDPELGALLARLDPGAEHVVRMEALDPAEVVRIAEAYVGRPLALEAAAAVAASALGIPGRVHADVESWARDRQLAAVARSVELVSTDWHGARRGETELSEALRTLAGVDSAAKTALLLAAGPPACPFPALAPFDAADAAFFAGREELVARAVAKLAVAGTVTLIGPSGAGKSSVARAGVVPALTSGALPGSEGWSVEVVTPSRAPIDAAARVDGGRVVVVDQLEDTLDLTDSARERFVGWLRGSVELGERVVLVVRSDHYTALSAVDGLADLMDTALQQVPAMTEAQLARAIEMPVTRAGGACEPGLTKALVEDLSGQSGALPLLSTTMTRLWEASVGGVLTLEGYARSGGVREAVARLAEEAYQFLDATQQSVARGLLMRMAGVGQGGTVVRAFVAIAALTPDARAVLGRLATARLVAIDGDEASVAHAAVFEHWPRLAGWLVEDADARAARNQLTRATQIWLEGGRVAADLLRGPRLAAALDLVDQPDLLEPDALLLVEQSVAAGDQEKQDLVERAERSRRTNRRLRSLLTLAVVLLLAAGSTTVLATRARREARRQAVAATARSLGAQALTTGRLDLAMLLAAQAATLDPSPETRGDLLSVVSRAPTVTHVLGGTGQRVLSLAVGGPGPRVVSLDRIGQARVYDAGTGKPLDAPGLAGLPAGASWQSGAFSPDGKQLVLGATVAGKPATGLLVFLDSRTLARSLPPLTWAAPVAAVTVTASGVVVLTADGVVHPVRTDGAPTAAEFPSGVQHPSGLEADRSGRWLLTEGPTSVWDTTTGRSLRLPSGYPGALSPDGELEAVASGDGVQVVGRGTGRLLHQLGGQAAPIEDLAFSPGGDQLASASDDGSVLVWSMKTGERLASLTGHSGRVNAVAFSPDGRTLVTGGFDGRTVTWAMGPPVVTPARTGISAIPPDVLSQSYLALSPATDRILVGEPDGTVVLATASTGAQLAAAAAVQPGGIYDAELSRDGRLGATVGDDRTIRVWDLVRATPYDHMPVLRVPTPPSSVALSPDDSTLAWGDVTGGVTLVSLADGSTLWHRQLDRADPSAGLRGAVTILSFSPDGHTLGAAVSHVATELMSVTANGEPRELHAADDNTDAFAFSPDGSTLITTDTDGTAWKWTVATGSRAELGTASANAASAEMLGASYDPGGDTVATWAQDGSLQLWDAQTVRPIGPAIQRPGSGPVVSAAWEGNERVDTLHADGRVRTLSVSATALVATACAVAGRTLSREEWAFYAPAIPYAPDCQAERA